MIDQTYHLAGVVGTPISHSRSPLIHNYWMKKCGIKGSYIPVNVKRKDFRQVLDTLCIMGFRGINVTIPHKEAAIRFADGVSDTAAVIGAANTIIYRRDGSSFADNTDGIGFMTNLKQVAPGWRSDAGPALILGAGGAARAVVHSLLWEGVPTIFLCNRTRERAEMLVSDFGNRVKILDWTRISGILPSIMTVVNTSSLGMHGQPSIMFPYVRLNSKALVSDVVYNPLETAFLLGAANRGCKVVDGLGMLLHQAAHSFHYWFNVKPEVTPELRRIVMEGL